jgi:hypothetical protein
VGVWLPGSQPGLGHAGGRYPSSRRSTRLNHHDVSALCAPLPPAVSLQRTATAEMDTPWGAGAPGTATGSALLAAAGPFAASAVSHEARQHSCNPPPPPFPRPHPGLHCTLQVPQWGCRWRCAPLEVWRPSGAGGLHSGPPHRPAVSEQLGPAFLLVADARHARHSPVRQPRPRPAYLIGREVPPLPPAQARTRPVVTTNLPGLPMVQAGRLGRLPVHSLQPRGRPVCGGGRGRRGGHLEPGSGAHG